MQGFKKVLVALLVVMTILGTMGPVFAAPADVKGQDLVNAVDRLAALKILEGYPNGNFGPDDPITRDQFAAVAVRALGLRTAADAAKGATKFPDVPANHWAAGYINVAVAQGIVKGLPDGTFAPSRNVTYAEAVAMIVRVLGYEKAVTGVWPANYLAKAAELELTKGINFDPSMPATRGNVALIVNKALDTKMMKQVYYGDQNQWTVSDKTLLEEKHGVKKLEGQVWANIQNDNTLDKNEFVLHLKDEDGKYLYSNGNPVLSETLEVVSDIDVIPLLGLEVVVWEKDNVVFNVTVKTASEDVLVDRIKDVKVNTDKIKLEKADKWYTVSDDAWIEYNNGEDYPTLQEISDNYKGKDVRVVLSKGQVIALQIFDWDGAGLVTDVNTDDEFIKIKQGGSVSKIKLDDKDYVVVKDGKSIELADIETNDIVEYIDGAVPYFLVTDNTVSGTLEKVKTDSSDIIVVVDGKEYKLENDPRATYSKEGDFYSAPAASSLTNEFDNIIGEDVVLHLNSFGRVQWLEAGEGSETSFKAVVIGAIASKVKVLKTDGTTAAYEYTADTDGTPFNTLSNGNVVDITLAADGTLDEINVITPEGGNVTAIDKDKKQITAGGTTFVVTSGTNILVADGGTNTYEAVDWDVVKEVNPATEPVTVAVVRDGTRTVGGNPVAKLIVITDGSEYLGSEAKVALVTGRFRVSGGWELGLLIKGTTEYYEVRNVTQAVYYNGVIVGTSNSIYDINKKDVVTYNITSSGKVDIREFTPMSGFAKAVVTKVSVKDGYFEMKELDANGNEVGNAVAVYTDEDTVFYNADDLAEIAFDEISVDDVVRAFDTDGDGIANAVVVIE